MFEKEAQKEFGISVVESPKMNSALELWGGIYCGKPYWVNTEEDIKTINFAKTISSETARLVTLDLGISVEGSVRADLLQGQINKMFGNIRNYVEKACFKGCVIFKPNGAGIDCVIPDNFRITSVDGDGYIDGAVFLDYYHTGKDFYTRMEWHRFQGNDYVVSNRAFVSNRENIMGRKITLRNTPTWKDILPEVHITKKDGTRIERPLFAVFRMPAANNMDISSPLGMSIFSDAVEELKDLDIAYSRNAGEILDSQKIILLDSDRMMQSGAPVRDMANSNRTDTAKRKLSLPHYVRNVYGDGTSSFYQEINPQLNTEARIRGINQQLSFIGYKCGYSNGYFVFDEKTGMITATQVEADDRRTIQLIKDIRDSLKVAMNDLFFALDKYADLYQMTPAGTYKVNYAFGDITYNWEEDRARHWQYVQSGKFPLWRYYMKFEGYSEKEAKEIVAESKGENKQTGLFGDGI